MNRFIALTLFWLAFLWCVGPILYAGWWVGYLAGDTLLDNTTFAVLTGILGVSIAAGETAQAVKFIAKELS